MTSKRIICCILALLMVFMSSCSKSESDESVDNGDIQNIDITDISNTDYDEFDLKIPYDFSEGVNPYLCLSSSNRFVNNLVYRSIVNLEPSYTYSLDLASSIETDDNTIWYIYIDGDIKFPNGSEFTTYDLKYSIQCAQSSNSYYSSSLNIISSINIINSQCLKITLKYANRYFPNLLYFPVIEYESIKKPIYFPDRYDFSDDRKYLISQDEKANIKKIELCEIDDKALLTYEMRMGKYDCIYVSDPMSIGNSSVGAIAGLQSNRMVYLGFNSSRGFGYYSDFRKAISASIDYDSVISEIYQNYASTPKGIYNCDFEDNKYIANRSLDLMSASLLLDEMGYSSYDNEGYRINHNGKRISLDLLVCNDNKTKVSMANKISEMLYKAGIEINIDSKSYNSYLSSIQNGNYDLYLAEVRIDPNMDISKLITPNAYKLADMQYIDYGIPESEQLYLKYLDYMSGNCSLNEFTNSFNEVIPYIPICFVKTCAIFSRDKTYSINGTAYDMFYNISEWK